MRNPQSSSPPVITGPGGDYRREHWPQPWWNRETFAAWLAILLILVAAAFEPKFACGLVAGIVCIAFFRRAA